MAPAAQEVDGEREERLLHILHVGRDCVDIQLVRWFLQLPPEEDAQAFVAGRRKICSSSAKTGLVKRCEVTPLPRTALEEHPDIAALGRVIDLVTDIFVKNGNAHMSYWCVAEVVEWGGPAFDRLRPHFTLPRLLAGFSLFDHNFQRKTCALSMRNFAVWGAEHCIKERLLRWQGGQPAEPLAEAALAADDGAGLAEPGRGEFVSLVDAMRQLHWSSRFAPPLGDFLEWAWRCPGLELGLRVSSAPFAGKDAQLESRDLSERAALRALARRLGARPSLAEHIAACRQALAWREYNLGPLEKFVKKYHAWFELRGDVLSLRPEKADGQAEAAAGEGPTAAAAPPALPVQAPADGAEGEAALEAEAEGEEEDSDEAENPAEPSSHSESGTFPARMAPRRFGPQLFQLWDGLPYDEACLQQALRMPCTSLGGPPAAGLPACALERLETLGAEVAALAQRQSLDAEDWLARLRVCTEVEAELCASPALAAEFPELRVRPFGTSASGLGQKGSDLDLLLELDGQGNAGVRRGRIPGILEEVGVALARRSDFGELQLVPQARVPLLRGVLRGVRLDLTVGSRCGRWNTRLLRRAAAQEPEVVVPLCVTAALWSKAVGINDSPNGLLSTYSVMLLVVFYLQTAGVLHIPDLRELAEADAEGEESPPQASGRAAHAELGRLLLGFFLFLSSFRWDAWVASVRCGAPLPRTEKPRAWQVQPLCVEDPFETQLNTCRRVNPRGQRQVLQAAGNALRAGLAGAGLAGAGLARLLA